jgi:hypothetical protein
VTHPTDPIAKRIAQLSALQRTQLDRLLREKGLCLDNVCASAKALRDQGIETRGDAQRVPEAPVPMDFSFMFFADNRSSQSADQYNLLLEAARFADQHDIRSIWIPERHTSTHSVGRTPTLQSSQRLA